MRAVDLARPDRDLLPFISADASGARHLHTVLSREQLRATGGRSARIARSSRADAALAGAHLRPDHIDDVMLVGGRPAGRGSAEVVRGSSARTPIARSTPTRGGGDRGRHPGGILQGDVKDLVLLDVTPHTLGIGTKDGTLHAGHRAQQHDPHPQEPRLHHGRRQPDPCRKCTSSRARATWPRTNRSLATFGCRDPTAPKGARRSRSPSRSTSNGIVTVSAQDQATGREAARSVRPLHPAGLSQAEVSRLVVEDPQPRGRRRPRRDEEGVIRRLDGPGRQHETLGPVPRGRAHGRRRRAASWTRAHKALEGADRGCTLDVCVDGSMRWRRPPPSRTGDPVRPWAHRAGHAGGRGIRRS